MKKSSISHIKKTLLPCIGLSALCGAFTGALIFLFKLVSGKVIELSETIYGFVRGDIRLLPLTVIAAAVIGLFAALLLHIEPNSRGGGIPTAVAEIRGLFEFRWLRSILMIFPSAMLTYFCGVPLGNEGPSVQMGCALGRGTVSVFGEKARPFDRYIMTGGACAGFAAATGAPLSGILFAIEEAHRKYSPMLFVTSSVSVMASMATSAVFEHFTGVKTALFDFRITASLPISSVWAALIPGILCGAFAIVFTRLYRYAGHFLSDKLSSIPLGVKTAVIFAVCAVSGYFVISSAGSGHSLVEGILESHITWYALAGILVLRVLLLIFANNAGVTGGLFLPILAIGAIVGSLSAKALIGMGLLSCEYYAVTAALGMVAFMSASSRTPVMAIAFGAEAILGASALFPTVIAAAAAYLTVELSGEVAFSDTVIEKKTSSERRGKKCEIVDAFLEVKEGCFAEGYELRDLLLPPMCVVLSVRRREDLGLTSVLGGGDVLHVRYQTFDPEYTAKKLCELFGAQTDTRENTFPGSGRHSVPEM